MNKTDKNGRTARDIAEDKGHLAILAELSGSGSQETVKNILEDNEDEGYLPKNVALPYELSAMIGDFVGTLHGPAKEDGEQMSKDRSLDRERLVERIDDYIKWSKEYAPGFFRLEHFRHGWLGRIRAENLLGIVNDQNKTDREVLNSVKKAAKDSGSAVHSLSRYLLDALGETAAVDDNKINRDDFAKIKKAWIRS